MVRLPRDKASFGRRYGAAAVEMETFAAAEVCRRRGVSFLSVRIINDTADETLPRDVEHLLNQTTGPARLGAALGAVWRRPGTKRPLPIAGKRPDRLQPIGPILGGLAAVSNRNGMKRCLLGSRLRVPPNLASVRQRFIPLRHFALIRGKQHNP